MGKFISQKVFNHLKPTLVVTLCIRMASDPHTRLTAGLLNISVFSSRSASGAQAARDVAEALCHTLSSKDRARVVFASAPSQREVLAGLAVNSDIDWSRVDAFHMDEYVGLRSDAPQCFAEFLRTSLWNKVGCTAQVIDGCAADTGTEAARYAGLLEAAPIDIVVLGIGENGHIAFNDPGCDLEDTASVRVVELPLSCRSQQVNDGCFAALEDVPTLAITLTVPALLRGAKLFCVVPGPTKTAAVRSTLTRPISNACPATVLRGHPNARIYLDDAAFGDLNLA